MKIGIVGCAGRMGHALVQELKSSYWQAKGLSLAGGTSRDPAPHSFDFFITENAEELFQKSNTIIDFTKVETVKTHVELAVKHKKSLVLGTTGLTKDDEALLTQAAKSIPIIYAANMSIGVNLLFSLVEQAAARLSADWDIEIFETHHKHKIDAPSGTALAIGRAAATGRGVSLDTHADYNRHGLTGAREKGKIGFSVARGGDVVGEHTAFFFGEGERLELTHRATDRSLFAKGALHGALWLKGKPAGLYAMRDVLDL